MTETEEALATALADGFNGVTDPDARQEKFTAEDFETHVRFLLPVVERLIALREAEALELMRQAAIRECAIVSDSPINCVDPCTEDWIAQRIGMLPTSKAELERQLEELKKPEVTT